MATSVLHHLAGVGQTNRNPILSLPSCATRLRINPACFAMPEDAGARDAKRRNRCHDEPSRSPVVKRRRRGDARVVPPHTSRKRETVKHHRDEESKESKRRRHYDDRRDTSSCSRSSFGGRMPATGGEVHAASREDPRRTAKNLERERARETTKGRNRSLSEPRAMPDPCAAQGQRHLPVAAIARPRAVSLDVRPPQEYTESFEEAKLRRMEIQRKREEARREMDKVVQTVYFNDPYISPLDMFKR
ncbi:hypothetical protein CFC21_022756 [Triticum aestivum]|uniref:TPX2 C-terminal domain-containing protein n=2 Tax=Triticum aestivum TaxID=4565 RepID=A0A9R1J860_WHEAT|nr:hypothetical protein CFC21_022756 [Triticum aestivum]